MKPPFKILLYFAGVLVFGSLLAAPLHWAVQHLARGAEAKGWLYYETEGPKTSAPAWEARGWSAIPLSWAMHTFESLAQKTGWLQAPEEGETRAAREEREKAAPPMTRYARKFAKFAEKRGWIQKKAEGPIEPEAKGWCAFLAADFSKVSNRAIIIAALVLLWPLLRSLRIRSMAEIGLHRNPWRWKDFAAGWSISVLVMLGLGVVLLRIGVYRMQENPPWGSLLVIFGSGLGIALLEEWVFRAAILGSFRKGMSDYLALFVVSALFSILHFLQSPARDLPEIGWLSGFEILPDRFAKFSRPMELLGGFTTLFAFGWICGWSVIRTRGLAMAIGFHAGMILGKMGFNRVTTRPKNMRDLLPWLGEDITIGVVGAGIVVLVGVLLWSYVRLVRTRPNL